MTWCIAFVPGPNESLFVEQASWYGVEAYLPRIRLERSSKSEPDDRPMFSNYVFVKQAPRWQRVYKVPTLGHIITRLDEVVCLSDIDLSLIKARDGEIVRLGSQRQNLRATPGLPVRIKYGPYALLQGVLLTAPRGKYVHVAIQGYPMSFPRCIVEFL